MSNLFPDLNQFDDYLRAGPIGIVSPIQGFGAILIVIVVISLLFAFRVSRTAFALLLVITGALTIFWGDLRVVDLTSYYVGSGLVVIGSFINRRSLWIGIRFPTSINDASTAS